ncbi:ribonuclease H1 domain-containing protein [Gudongella sp. SC589]|jgi:ribonuclease HI|uniref:ribonuclease H1 domain-containing protein n=1 Tax=Gudongella sp. SC589 TaxID=3385990 RepID=UPI00390478F2
MAKFYYAVKKGLVPGIYNSWEECKNQVHGFPGAVYKKFNSKSEAEGFLGDNERSERIIEEIDDVEAAVAYVDGSYNLDTGTYSYGVVIISDGQKHGFSGREENPQLASMRNVAGELKGAMVAMDWALAQKKKTLYLHYDYTGIENWAKGNWKTNRDGTRDYKKYYDSIKDRLEVKFIKVKAHSGNELNDEADQLAKDAIL